MSHAHHNTHLDSHPTNDTLSGQPQFTSIAQSAPQTSTPNTDGTSTVTTTGNIVQSSDPSTSPSASLSQKLTGDLKGAVSGTIGGLQAAAGAMTGNKGMQEKGQEKMSVEDQRLGAKRGVMPVGSERREGVEEAVPGKTV